MNTKELQMRVNIHVVNMQQDLRNVWNNKCPVAIKRLRYCKAWVYTFVDENGDTYYVLRSYGTMVACVSPIGAKYDWLRYAYGYTATSAQHIAKFFNDYAPLSNIMYRYYPV